MRWNKVVNIVGAHAEGEIGRVVTGGQLDLPGSSMVEKLAYLNREYDDLRTFCLYEPRGCAQMTTNLLLPPVNSDADAAFIPMQADGSHAMSGSNAICVTTVLLETGILPMVEPETTVVLETAAGLVRAKADCRDGKVERVTLDFFPSFVEHLGHPLELDGYGTLKVDVAFGGVYYVLPDARSLGLSIEPGSARDLVEIGNRIKSAAREQISVAHPEIPSFNDIEFVMFCGRDTDSGYVFRNGTVMPPGRMDRSPCGTGTAARLAVLHEKGELEIGQPVEMRSTINSKFEAQILGTTKIGARRAVLPRMTGRAWIYGIYQLGADPSDPFRGGFTMADTWGTGMEHHIPEV
ncbi:MAG: proline racemase [Hyphomicrobiales bacterium]|nr:proline racemase [Hyphomicrobiales bacterium]